MGGGGNMPLILVLERYWQVDLEKSQGYRKKPCLNKPNKPKIKEGKKHIYGYNAYIKPCVVVQTYNPHTREAETKDSWKPA